MVTAAGLSVKSVSGTTSTAGGVTYTNVSYDLEAKINPSTGAETAGTLTLLDSNSHTLLDANLTGLTSSNNLNTLDFTFTEKTSGLVSAGTSFLVEVTEKTPQSGLSWSANFSGTVSNFATPLPKSAVAGLGLFGLLAMGGKLRRRSLAL